MKFPERIYTVDEFMAARRSIQEGHRHHLEISGSPAFRERVDEVVTLIKTAGYDDFLRTYIRRIAEIGGVSQLREAEATIWLSTYLLKNPVEGARFIVQKAHQMEAYLTGRVYYILGERPAVQKSVAFLRELKAHLQDEAMLALCEDVLTQWTADEVL